MLELALVLLEAFDDSIDEVFAVGIDAGDVEIREGERRRLILNYLLNKKCSFKNDAFKDERSSNEITSSPSTVSLITSF